VKRFLILTSVVMFAVGCGSAVPTTPSSVAKSNDPPSHNHPTTGPHGGPIVEWGDELHLEVVIDRTAGTATVYVLDEDVKTSMAITTKTMTLTLIGTPPVEVTLTADPDAGDKVLNGMSSRFVGKHEAFKKEELMSGSVSGMKDGDERSGKFKEKKPKAK